MKKRNNSTGNKHKMGQVFCLKAYIEITVFMILDCWISNSSNF